MEDEGWSEEADKEAVEVEAGNIGEREEDGEGENVDVEGDGLEGDGARRWLMRVRQCKEDAVDSKASNRSKHSSLKEEEIRYKDAFERSRGCHREE